jgi:hypothetical protein
MEPGDALRVGDNNGTYRSFLDSPDFHGGEQARDFHYLAYVWSILYTRSAQVRKSTVPEDENPRPNKPRYPPRNYHYYLLILI